MFAQQHELKLLNFGLILYICFGTILFYSIGEFDHHSSQHQKHTLTSSIGNSLDHLGSINDQLASRENAPTKQEEAKKQKALKSLHELRMNSVRRMWNITNQLNILYESNWTELILAELIKFETKFVHSLESSSAAIEDDDNQDSSDHDSNSSDNERDSMGDLDDDEKRSKSKEDEIEQKSKKSNDNEKMKSRSERKQTNLSRIKLKSIKKALIHSIATVTTMNSPIKLSSVARGESSSPPDRLIKLATIIYGSLGIPLLILTVAKSGSRLAYSSLNSLIVIRHYCFSLPVHYLSCCSRCSPFSCLRAVLSWCCCCCCCFNYLLCCLLRDRDSKKQSTATDRRQKASKRPVLRLVRRKPLGGATGPRKSAATRRATDDNDLLLQQQQQQHNQLRSPFVIGFNLDPNQQAEKAVRFVGGAQTNSHHYQPANCDRQHPQAHSNEPRSIETWEPKNDDDDDEFEFYSFGVVSTGAIILIAYLSMGAYYYSRAQDMTFVDALFACYSMLSASKLPESFNLDSPRQGINVKNSPLGLYESLLRSNSDESRHRRAETTYALLRDSIYLLIGLNLVSTFAHFARLWFEGTTKRRRQLEASEERKHPDDGLITMNGGFITSGGGGDNNNQSTSFNAAAGGSFNQSNQFNGGGGSGGSIPMNELDNSSSSFAASAPAAPATSSNQLVAFNQQLPAAHHQLDLNLNAATEQYLPTSEIANCLDISGQQEQPHIDLSELYVVDAADIDHNHRQQQHLIGIKPAAILQQHHSDGSFTSDRSSETRSLCLRHQAQLQQQQQQQQLPTTTIANNYNNSSLNRPGQRVKQSSNNLHLNHIGLIQRNGDDQLDVARLNGNEASLVMMNGNGGGKEEEDEEEEMNRLLANCLQTTKFALNNNNNGHQQQMDGKLQPSSSTIRLADYFDQQQQQLTGTLNSDEPRQNASASLYGTLNNNNRHHRLHSSSSSSIKEINHQHDHYQTARRKQQQASKTSELPLLDSNNNNIITTTTNNGHSHDCDSSPNTIDSSNSISGSQRVLKLPTSKQQQQKYNSIDRQNHIQSHRSYHYVHPTPDQSMS